MGLLERVFRKTQESVKEEVKPEIKGITDIEELLRSSRQKESRRFNEMARKSFEEISVRLGRLDSNLKALETENFDEDMHPRLKRILLDNKSNMATKIRRMMWHLAAKPSDDVETIERYFDISLIEISKTVSDTDIARRKLSEFISEKVSAVAQGVNRLAEFVETQTTKVSEMADGIRAIDELAEKTIAIDSADLEAAGKEAEIRSIKKKIEDLEGRCKSMENTLSQMMQSTAYAELKETERERNELLNSLKKNDGNFSNRLSVFNKPLRKLLHLPENEKRNHLAKRVDYTAGTPIDDLLISSLRDIMPSLKAAVEDGRIELKEDARKKVLAKISEMDEDYLDAFLAEKTRLEDAVRNINGRIEELSMGHHDFESGISAIKQAIDDEKKRLADAEDVLRRTSERMKNLKAGLEKGLETNLGMKIRVSI